MTNSLGGGLLKNCVLLLRSLIFDCLFYSCSLVVALLVPFLLLCPRRFVWRFGRLWIVFSLFLMRFLLGLTYEIRGKDYLPEAPFLLASKHQSAWETLAFFGIFPDPIFLLKKSLMDIPFLGWGLRKIQMIPVDRSQGRGFTKVIQQAKNILSKGRILVVFPEGTRTFPGDPPTYKRGLWMLYRHLDVPVVPLALNTGLFWPRRAWIKRPGKVILQLGAPLPPGLKDEKLFKDWLFRSIEHPSQQLCGRPE
jgi:1-acyl-sn-glycerol-3-phosphate acyltransferase